MQGRFDEEYKKLNPAQREAVDTIEGPVMVVAGPGTGKTEVLALRIANILTKTDTKSDSILCLTFTNSGVRAMRERLRKYIGGEALKVQVSTFHTFAMSIIENYFGVLGRDEMPKIMDDSDIVALCDAIFQNNEWQYLRPRSDTSRYFNDLKSLISLLKRERINPEDFERSIKEEIEKIKNDPENISSRGESKGELKKEILKKIESLSRTEESVKFYELYELAKKENNFFDYDDVLACLVEIIEESEDAGSYLREQYQYILIDEHQDSSGVQNEFLEKVWSEVELPNIFVVGDDRQLIYGFGGASLEYFENFKHAFGKAKLITLIENYRSTQNILDISHSLLESSITKEKLKSNSMHNHPVCLIEANYPRDEIILSGLEIQKRIKNGEDPNDMAILVPKNKHLRSALSVLHDMGIPVASGEKLNFFDSRDAQSFLRVLKIISEPNDGVAIGESFFDPLSGIAPLEAHKFLKINNMRDFSILTIDLKKVSLFENFENVLAWIDKLKSWINIISSESIYSLVQGIGSEYLLDNAKNHEELVLRVEVLRTVLHLLLAQVEKNPKFTLLDFVLYLERIEAYGEHIPLAVFSGDEGVKVLTLHGSKGLEFDFVWIAHMDEKSLAGSYKGGFALPENLLEKIEKKDEMVLRRQLYVALTRAKRFCAVSYALHSYSGGDLGLAHIVSEIGTHFEKQNAKETENIILKNDPRNYIGKKGEATHTDILDLIKLVAKEYEDKKVSVSLLNNFFECPWKWYFRNLLQLPEPKSGSLEFGNLVHGCIDKILKMDHTPNKAELEEITEKNKEVLNIISKWIKNRLPEISEMRKNEESISKKDDRFPHLNIYGKIDLIEVLNDEDMRVTDFKTGNPRKKSEIEKVDEDGRMSDYMRQLAMYSYLLNDSKWKRKVVESALEFVEAKNEKESFYKTFIDEEHIKSLICDISDYDKFVKDGTWTTRICNFKSYGKQNSICEYCKRAEIYGRSK